jgi:hypothetical protein
MFCSISRVFILSYFLYYNFITYFICGIIINNDKIVVIDDDDDANTNTDGINPDVSACIPSTPELNNISSKFINIRNDNADKISLNQYHYEDVKQKDISNYSNNDELYSYIDNSKGCSCAATHRNIDVMNTNSSISQSYLVNTTNPSANVVDNDNIYSKNIDSKDNDVLESSIIATCRSSSSNSRSSSSNCNDHFMIHELNKKMVRIEGGLGYMGTNKPIKPTDGEYPLRAIELSTYLLDIYEVSNNGK